jgi:MFS family permease
MRTHESSPAPYVLPLPQHAAAPGLTPRRVFLCVFLPFAFGHYLSLLLRNINALLAPSLVNSLSLDPGQLGLLTSAFFFTYALVQLPVGLALDRYGPRKVQLLLLLLAAMGALLFASGHTYGELLVARALIGLGLAGCFMSAVKALSSCVAPSRLPSINGYLLAVGGLGSASATLPVRMALQHTDWRGLFVLLAILTALTALVIWLLVPQAPAVPNTKPATLASLGDVYRNPEFRKTVTLILVPHTVFFGIQGLWLGRWLSDVAHFSDAAVAYLLYLSMAAVIFGAIAVGLITERAGRRGIKSQDVAAVGIGLFLLVQVTIMLNHKPSMQLMAVLFTLVGSITGIEYTIVAQSVPRELTGRASTCLNLLIFVGAFIVQAGFGQVIGLWHPGPGGQYPAVAYQVGFAVLILLQLPGVAVYLLRRRPVKCAIPEFIPKEEEYEVSSLRSSR